MGRNVDQDGQVSAETAAGTYLYCIVRRRSAPTGARAPRGLPGLGRVRTVDAGDGLWLVAADAPAARFAPRAIEARLRDLDWVSACAVAHEKVVAHYGRGAAALPVKLFTLFSSDAKAVADVRGKRRRLSRLLTHVDGREEWGVRLRVDPSAATRRAAPAARTTASAGTRFLLRKSAAQTAGRKAVAAASGHAERAYRSLRRLAADARRRAPAAVDAPTRLVLDAAFLLDRRRVAGFRKAVAGLARRLGPDGYRFELTGPWPPYSFVNGA
jgi:hypothetical protein